MPPPSRHNTRNGLDDSSMPRSFPFLVTAVQSIANSSLGSWHWRVMPSGLLMVLRLDKVSSYFARSHEVRQQAKIPCLVPDTSGDNRRMNAEPLRQLHDRKWGRMVLHTTRLPHVLGNKRMFRPRVRFVFFGITTYTFDITQTQVVDERL